MMRSKLFLLKIIITICISLSSLNLHAVQNQSALNSPDKIVKVGLLHSPPVIILDSNGNAPQGFMVDILTDLAEKEEWQIEWVQDSWNNLLTKAKNKEVDLLVFVAYTEERAKYLDFSRENLLTGWGQVFTHADGSYQNILDYDDQPIAVLKSGAHGLAFKELCTKFNVNCLIKEVDSFQKGFELLANKKVAGVITSNWTGHNYMQLYDIVPTSVIFNPQPTLFAVPKGINRDILKTLDKYVLQWRANEISAYYAAQDKWLKTRTHTSNQWLASTLMVISALFLISAVITYILRQQVKNKTADLHRQSRQTRQIIDLIPHFIYAANDKDEIFLMNEYAADFCGLKLDDYDTLPKSQLVEKYGATIALFGGDQALLKKGAKIHRSELKTKNSKGDEAYFNLIKVPFTSSSTDSRAVVAVGVDVTEAKKYQQQIEHMSYHDPLTKLPNRILLNDRLKQSVALSVRQGYSGAILLIDLDDFKTFNHQYGQQVGDLLLKTIAERITSFIKDGDTVARLSSDTFVVQLNELSIIPSEADEAAFKVANRIQDAINLPVSFEGVAHHATASIGIVIYPFDSKNAANIIPRAEAATRNAKVNGKNKVVRFTGEMESAVFHKHLLNSELQTAINRNEFHLYYQPQVSSDSSKPIGFEALIRWDHKQHGLIYPGDFIAAAEKNNLIISIGHWVIERAISDLKKLSETSLNKAFIGINLSVIQIKDPKLVPLIKRLLEQYQVNPSQIEFEITETVLFQDIGDSMQTISGIKELGCKLSIDDFGTGYSSLSYINQLPLDKLKIDRSFIQDIEKDKGSQAIVKTIVNMAQDLGITVLAEGVEEQSQLEYLQTINCHYFQGFYFNKAMSFDRVIETYAKETQ